MTFRLQFPDANLKQTRNSNESFVSSGPFALVSLHVVLMELMCFQGSFFTDHPFSSSANDPLAVPGACDGRHTHVMCAVNDEHETTTLWCERSNLAVVPRWKKGEIYF